MREPDFDKAAYRERNKVERLAGIVALGRERQEIILDAIGTSDRFEADNDRYGEHNFGVTEAGGERVMFKIDYFDRSGRFASPDPASTDVTARVLTVMLAGE